MSCYAYRDSQSEELLDFHSIEVAGCAGRRWETEAISGKISTVLGIDRRLVRDSIVLASALHDIGKSLMKYQTECVRGICKSFWQHYVDSVVLTAIILLEAGLPLSSSFERIKKILGGDKQAVKDYWFDMMILLPIALHHYHQIEGYKSLKVSEVKNLNIYSGCYPCLDRISEYLTSILTVEEFSRVPTVLRNVGELINKDSDSISIARSYASNLYSSITHRSSLTGLSITKVVIESVAGIINLCDGYVASRARAKK